MNIFKDIGGFFKKVFSSEQNWQKAASVTLTVAQPLVQTLLVLTAGPTVAEGEANIVKTIQADLNTVTSIVTTAGSNPSVGTILNAILANLKSVEAGVNIKDPTSQTAFTAITTTLVAEIEAVIEELPVIKGTTVTPTQTTTASTQTTITPTQVLS